MSVSVGPAVDVSYDNDWPYEEQKKTGGSSELAAIINSIWHWQRGKREAAEGHPWR